MHTSACHGLKGPVVTNPGPPGPGVCILSDPFPYAKTCKRYHAHIEGMEIPEPLTRYPPEILAMMYAAIHKRHEGLEQIYDFSAVDKNIVEIHLMTILTKVLEDDKTYDGKAAHGRAETGHPRLHGLGGHGPGGGVRVGCVSSLWEQGRCSDSGVVSVDVLREYPTDPI